ncbi:rRNA-processing protein EFG1 [Penicillium bovifimosum]|uniref:rRNA-processing protein EFG1 n=1 Tax=Penicillium bovifimosum TaxID=126998 RepID=A0A9W9GVV8_9EURO|nr:rRNA-processing protein EFG1 [Penicillium bovifimosum]KAJ5131020.1 rRNA-processing protein EFG1 [Penicillium bovifimosum]
MTSDAKSHRDQAAPSKRKARDGSEDAAPARKKAHRKVKAGEFGHYEEFGSGSETSKVKPARKYKDKFAPKPEKEYPSVNELKKRIRDVKRLLNKADKLSADTRILQERALAGYEQDLADEIARRERSHLITKYHFVRFLDRKTANKQLNRLTRREKEENLDPKEKARLAEKIHICQVNLNYTIYYPLTEKYISLYPKTNGKPDAAGSESETQKKDITSNEAKPPMWAIVEKCMEEKTLDLLREGKLNINYKGEKIEPASSGTGAPDTGKEKTKKKEHGGTKGATQKDKHDKNSSKTEKSRSEGAFKKQQKHGAPPVNEEDGDESDGGFFE